MRSNEKAVLAFNLHRKSTFFNKRIILRSILDIVAAYQNWDASGPKLCQLLWTKIASMDQNWDAKLTETPNICVNANHKECNTV